MFRMGGADVRLIGFHRKAAAASIGRITTLDLGQTTDGKLAERAIVTLRAVVRYRAIQPLIEGADVIVARNLEMLAIAARVRGAKRSIPLVYESLDIHRLLLGSGLVSRLLRGLEGWLSRKASLLITSSPAFVENYFEQISSVRLPVLLIENKVFTGDGTVSVPVRGRVSAKPWQIGWFGAIRCARSFSLLSRLTRSFGGEIEVVIRGRPTAAVFSDFESLVASEPFMRFEGAYRNPDDLAKIYGEVDFAWAIDFFEEGQNSEWLLPNRLYESGWSGAIPLALARTATGRWLASKDVGVRLDGPLDRSLSDFFRELKEEDLAVHRRRIAALDPATWLCLPEECSALVTRMARLQRREPVST